VTISPGLPDKAELRRTFLGFRLGLGDLASALGAEAQERLLGQAVFDEARAVMVYLAFRGEVPTSRIMEEALAAGKIVCAPVTLLTERRLLALRLRGGFAELRPGPYGIMEPDPSRCEPFAVGGLDLVVVPGVAFDATGGRLGYGGGYYDRFLTGDAISAVRVALAFEVQISPEPLPLDPYDAQMDLVCTEKRIIRGVGRERETARQRGEWGDG